MDGEQIRLRDFMAKDLARYEAYLAPEQEWRRWDGPYRPAGDAEWIRKHMDMVRRQIEGDEFDRPRRRQVIASRDSDALLGTVSRYWISEETHWPAIGIGIYDPAWWGKGIGFEALTLWCDYLFASLPDIVRIDMRTWSGNERMIRLAHRLGFKEEARFRNARIVRDEHFDGLGFGILRDEWEAR